MLSANANITVNVVYMLFHTADLPNLMRHEFKHDFYLIFHFSSITSTVLETVNVK